MNHPHVCDIDLLYSNLHHIEQLWGFRSFDNFIKIIQIKIHITVGNVRPSHCDSILIFEVYTQIKYMFPNPSWFILLYVHWTNERILFFFQYIIWSPSF